MGKKRSVFFVEGNDKGGFYNLIKVNSDRKMARLKKVKGLVSSIEKNQPINSLRCNETKPCFRYGNRDQLRLSGGHYAFNANEKEFEIFQSRNE